MRRTEPRGRAGLSLVKAGTDGGSTASTGRRLKVPGLVTEALELLRLPAVTIEMSGDVECRVLYDHFTRRHPKYRLIKNKTWGVALLPLPDTFADYFGGRDRHRLRGHVNRATKAGFTFGPLDPVARLDEIMTINRSVDERQGRAMHRDYFDVETVRRYYERTSEVYGVSDADGVLQAYADFHDCGQVASLARLLGHADALPSGVMYLLLTEIIRELIDRRQRTGAPDWFMYDMFSGGSAGMARFKQTLGCDPYRVTWIWRS